MLLRASDYVALVERAARAGADIPIIPGIMPILNLRQVSGWPSSPARELPEEIAARLAVHADDPARCAPRGSRSPPSSATELLDAGAPGLHFYTLNRSKATREIFAALTACTV